VPLKSLSHTPSVATKIMTLASTSLFCALFVGAVLLLLTDPALALPNIGVRGCTNWANGKCIGVWFQVGGGDCCGGSIVHQVLECPSSMSLCLANDTTGPQIGVYLDDTTPCPASLAHAPGATEYQGVWYGRPCVQYWVNQELNNPKHGIILAALPPQGAGAPGINRFAPYTGATATILECYPISGGSFDVNPKKHPLCRKHMQGYILQRLYANHSKKSKKLANKLWAWGKKNTRGVLAFW